MPEPSAPRYEAPFRACMGEAAKRGAHLMDRLVESVRLSMQQRGQNAEALRLLLQYRTRLCEGYPAALLDEFAVALGAQSDKAGTSGLSFDSLELMAEDQVQESVEVLRAQQATQQAVESVIGEFNALVCAAQGLKTVQVERNPLRPEVYVRALRGVTSTTGVPAAMRLTWMQHFGEALGPLLANDYTYLSGLLRAQGVQQAGFNVVNLAPNVAVSAAATPGGLRADTLLTVRQLRKLLTGELDPGKDSFDAQFAREFESGDREFPAEFSPTVPAAFEALQEMKQVDEVMNRLARQNDATADGRTGGEPSLRQQLRAQASPGQALGLEVVSLMVDNIAADARLLPQVQQLVRELEPALLRLALIDPRFFSDKRHPARQLLEQLTQRSLAWPMAESAGFAGFLAPAREAVQALLTTRIAGPEPFAFALQSLGEVWDELQKRERRKREKAVRALVQAEQRNMLAEKIATELRRRAETAGVPRGIVFFVAGPWSQVIAQARLSDTSGQTDPGGYEDLVTDLLWSALPGVASSNPARLARLVPGLLARLREGLESIGFSRAKSSRFFEELVALHAQGTRAALEAGTHHESLLDDSGDSRLWLAPSEVKQSGFVETQLVADEPAPLFEETQLTGDEAAWAQATPMQALAPGAWVELRMDDVWVRTQLSWASPHGTLFMFTNADGVNHSMTRQSLERLNASGNLRVLATQAVVAGALDAVAQAALRNSLDVTL